MSRQILKEVGCDSGDRLGEPNRVEWQYGGGLKALLGEVGEEESKGECLGLFGQCLG